MADGNLKSPFCAIGEFRTIYEDDRSTASAAVSVAEAAATAGAAVVAEAAVVAATATATERVHSVP